MTDTAGDPAANPTAAPAAPTVFPCIAYRDARTAIDWLDAAFGFEAVMVHPGGDDRPVAHAELRLDGGVVIVSSLSAGATGIGQPGNPEVDFATVPFSIYVLVADVDAHCARARAAGATVVREPADTDYGSRDYVCRDIEGNVWSFGTYRPGS